jgi:hypothetical protein
VGYSRIGTVKGSFVTWALRGATRYAIAAAIVALILACFLPDTDAERFATTAYLAAIFAALALGTQRLVRDPSTEALGLRSNLSFPGILMFCVGLVILLSAASSFVTDPGAEARLIVYCAIAVLAAAIGRAGALAWLHAKLVAGGPLEASARYLVLVAASALLLSALLPSPSVEFFATLAYAATALATPLIAWSLIGPTPLGALFRQTYADGGEVVAQLSGARVFARMIDASVVTMVASIAAASLLRRPYSEPFATVAWIAAIFAAIGLGIECRRRLTGSSADEPEIEWPLRRIDLTRIRPVVGFTQRLTLENAIRCAACTTIAAFLIASSLLRRYGEPFAIVGYCAAVVLTPAVALACLQAIPRRSVPKP